MYLQYSSTNTVVPRDAHYYAVSTTVLMCTSLVLMTWQVMGSICNLYGYIKVEWRYHRLLSLQARHTGARSNRVALEYDSRCSQHMTPNRSLFLMYPSEEGRCATVFHLYTDLLYYSYHNVVPCDVYLYAIRTTVLTWKPTNLIS